MLVKIIVDNKKSWMNAYADVIVSKIVINDFDVIFQNDYNDLIKSDFTFFLSCEKKIKKEYLELSQNNLLVHESDLPNGRGWSPLTYQILDGNRIIPIALLKVANTIDAGDICLVDYMHFKGNELIDEIRKVQVSYTTNLILNYLKNYNSITCKKQFGKPTYYKRRSKSDSELDITKSIEDQFNLLRVVDNSRYPAFFYIQGEKYIIEIYKEESKK